MCNRLLDIGYHNYRSLFGNVMINLPNSNYLLVLLMLLFKKKYYKFRPPSSETTKIAPVKILILKYKEKKEILNISCHKT